MEKLCSSAACASVKQAYEQIMFFIVASKLLEKLCSSVARLQTCLWKSYGLQLLSCKHAYGQFMLFGFKQAYGNVMFFSS